MNTMKKGILVVMSMALLVACGQKEVKKENTVPKVETRDMKGLKIAYYNSDSLKTLFTYYKEQDAIVTKKQKAFQSEVDRRTKEFQSYVYRNEERLRSGLLSENETVQIQQKVQQMESDLMQYQQTQGAKLEKETMEKLEVISKKIETFGKKFSEENNIDILLIHGAGGQINYINGSMDVTKEFCAFLNQHQEDIEKDMK
jgi:outer membrane protein